MSSLAVPNELVERAKSTQSRLEKTNGSLEAFQLKSRHPWLAIFATGSLGRHEVGAYSDLDVFLVDATPPGEPGVSRLLTIEIQAALIGAAGAAGFPPFSRDGEFLQLHRLSALLEKLGKPDEDALNVFTARMLLLLESERLVGDEAYGRCLDTVIDRYWAEAPSRSDFRPTFLINDIVRYWKTLCLSYEGWRASPGAELDADGRIDLLKLKFNRLWLCFNGLAYLLLGDEDGRYERSHAVDLATKTPVQRIVSLVEREPGLTEQAQQVLDGYAWWLARSGAAKTEVRDWISEETAYGEATDRARSFGDGMHEIVMHLGERAGLARYLLV